MVENLKYKIENNEKRVKIFGKDFSKINKNNFELIYNEEKIELSEFLDLKNDKKGNKVIEIQLRKINNITNISMMFADCKQLISIKSVSKFETKNVTNMSFMFKGFSSLLFFGDISYRDISNFKDISSMFQDCSLLSSLPDISKWDTSNVINMKKIFYGCSS